MTGPVKAYLQSEQGTRIECLFNPAELKLSRSNNWSATKAKGKNTPPLRFQEGQSGSLTMSLILDTTASGDPVTKHTNRLLDLMQVDQDLAGADTKRNRARPPWVRFHWGDFRSFKAVVEQLQLTFTYFSSSGVPLRANAELTLKQYEDEQAWAPQNPTSGTPSPHRVHQVTGGESIDRIAALHYGDATRWRLIADANAVIDPLRLRPGVVLVIPEIEAVRRG
jgi:hypothetical protein